MKTHFFPSGITFPYCFFSRNKKKVPVEKQSFSRFLSSKSLFLKSSNNVKPLKPELGHISVLPGVQQIAAESGTPPHTYPSTGRGSLAFPETSRSVTATRLEPPSAACHCGCSRAALSAKLEDNHTIKARRQIYSNTFHN